MGRDRDRFRKFESGSQKAKRRKIRENFLEKQKGAFEKFLTTNASADIEEESSAANELHLVAFSSSEFPNELDGNDQIETETESATNGIAETISFEETVDSDQLLIVLQNMEDPSDWPSLLNTQQIDFIIEKGPIQIKNIDFPAQANCFENKRKFTEDHYIRVLANGERISRKWLVYSMKKDAVFCFCCKLFGSTTGGSLVEGGFADWKHISERLKSHEASANHFKNLKKWTETEIRLKRNVTIDQENLTLLKKETAHWRGVLTRILHVIQYLAEHNQALRGDSDVLFTPNNGNFLGLVEMLAKFDPIISEHIRRIKTKTIHDHYLGKTIQNELLNLLSASVLNVICRKIRNEKYYAIILDCTPDQGRKEQLSIILRCVDTHSANVKVEEHFIKFVDVYSSTGEQLSLTVLSELEKLKINIEDCRGQGYDNGANMKGKYRGVQARLLQRNPRAFFTPCACHNLNLMLGDMAKSSSSAMSFFGIINRIYNIFAASPFRWAILQSHVPKYTVKRASDTRWESRIDSVKPIRFQAVAIRDALIEVSETTDDPTAKSESEGLVENNLESFEFLVSVVIWYDVLLAVNAVSKKLQSKDMELDIAIDALKGLLQFLRNYRNEGFSSAVNEAKQIAVTLDINPHFNFKQSRIRRKKKHFDYEAEDQPINLQKSPEESFKIEYFYKILDVAINAMHERFEQFEKYAEEFNFLYSPRKLFNSTDEDLKKFCADLDIVLRDGDQRDIDGDQLFNELKILKDLLPSTTSTPTEVLQFIKSLDNPFPNAFVAYRIMLTIPITVASAERSFSRLKLIKTYLRATMGQDRLSSLAILSIEKDVVSNLDYDDVINEFARVKARKVNFI